MLQRVVIFHITLSFPSALLWAHLTQVTIEILISFCGIHCFEQVPVHLPPPVFNQI